MNKNYSRKKKITIAALTLVAVCLAGGLCYYMSVLNRSTPPAPEPEREPASKVEILVPEINTDTTLPASNEAESETEIQQPSNDSTETVGDDVQAKPSADQPKSPSEATPPTHVPTENDIAPVENPDGSGECQPEQTSQPEPNQPQSGDTNSSGAVYVPGFGWIEDSGESNTNTTAPNAGTGEPIGDM